MVRQLSGRALDEAIEAMEARQLQPRQWRALQLGAPREDLGTKSVRKCADTFAVNCPYGP